MNTKQETPSAIRWLYRHIFRGVGLVVLAGILSWLYLFFRAGAHR